MTIKPFVVNLTDNEKKLAEQLDIEDEQTRYAVYALRKICPARVFVMIHTEVGPDSTVCLCVDVKEGNKFILMQEHIYTLTREENKFVFRSACEEFVSYEIRGIQLDDCFECGRAFVMCPHVTVPYCRFCDNEYVDYKKVGSECLYCILDGTCELKLSSFGPKEVLQIASQILEFGIVDKEKYTAKLRERTGIQYMVGSFYFIGCQAGSFRQQGGKY